MIGVMILVSFWNSQNLDEWQSLKLFGSYLENEFRGSKQQLLVSEANN